MIYTAVAHKLATPVARHNRTNNTHQRLWLHISAAQYSLKMDTPTDRSTFLLLLIFLFLCFQCLVLRLYVVRGGGLVTRHGEQLGACGG